MRVLLLTSGGHIDFYSALRTIIYALRDSGHETLGSLGGWKGIERGGDGVVDLTSHPIDQLGILGGSFIHSDRKKPDLERVIANKKKYGVEVIVAFGGDDTQRVARDLHEQFRMPVVGWAKTMDNDTNGSYATIGYITAACLASMHIFHAFATAYTHGRIVIAPMFGRNYDWVVGAAADYGHADFMVPAEKRNLTLDEVVKGIKATYEGNRSKYGRAFAVVAVSEAAIGLKGLEPYAKQRAPDWDEAKVDDFGNKKLEPEVLALSLRDALRKEAGIKGENIAPNVISYPLRDSNLVELDNLFARKAAEECVRHIDRGEYGMVATIQDPRVSGFLPNDPATHIYAHGTLLYVGGIPLKQAAEKRPVTGTGFIDYGLLRTTKAFSEYLKPLLGPKPENPRDKIVPFKVAVPVGIELS